MRTPFPDLAWWLVALVLLAASPRSAAQGTVAPPMTGYFDHDGEFARTSINGSLAEEMEAFHRKVHVTTSPCGDSLRFGITHLFAQAILTLDGDRYRGSFDIDDQLQQIDLLPESSDRFRLVWNNRKKDGGRMFGVSGFGDVFSIETEVSFSRRTDEDDPGGRTGRGVFEPRVIEERRIGPVWVEEEILYTVVLWGFDVNGADLQPEHVRVIDEGLAHALEQEAAMASGGESCSRIASVDMSSEVHGYASQTGPERTNRRLAGLRADAVSRRIGERAPELYEGVWIGRPIPRAIDGPLAVDHPGLESSCNRAAYFQFVVKREFVEPYAAEAMRDWLRESLAAVCAQPSRFSEGEQRVMRLQRKARHVLAMNYLDMIEAGHCDPSESRSDFWGAGGPPASALLDSDAHRTETTVPTPFQGIQRAYDLADDPSNYPLVQGGFDLTEMKRQHEANMRLDPYYRYTFQDNPSARSASDAIEEAACGSVSTWEPGTLDATTLEFWRPLLDAFSSD